MIRLENIQKTFAGFVLSGISFEIQKGEYFVVLGPSGAGKTVLLEIMAGLIKPDSGRIEGLEKSGIGLIYQDYMLFPHLNVFQNIAYGLHIKNARREKVQASVQKVTEELDISHLLGRRIEGLSGGEKQRVAIARTMVLEPDIFLLDEPTAALDWSTKSKTQNLILRLHKKHQTTMVHVTHDFEEALALSDRIAVLMNGRVIQTGNPEQVFNNPATREVADFMGYKNVYSGEIKNGAMTVNGKRIFTLGPDAASAYVAVHSSDILLSQKRIQSSARNSFPCKVVQIISRGSHVEVILDGGIMFHANITYQSLQDLNIFLDSKLWATFKTSAVKTFIR